MLESRFKRCKALFNPSKAGRARQFAFTMDNRQNDHHIRSDDDVSMEAK